MKNIVNGKKVVITHGEVCLVPTNAPIEGEVSKHKTYIVGHSETGHHHVLESPVEFEVQEWEGRLKLNLFETADLVHKKTYQIHETRQITPGFYDVFKKTEYDPFQKIVREIWD